MTLLLAVAFLGSGMAAVARELTGSKEVYLFVSLAAVFCFTGVRLVRPVRVWRFGNDNRMLVFLGLASSVAILSGIFTLSAERLPASAVSMSLSKAAGLVLSLLLLCKFAPSFREKEIRYALITYAAIEMIVFFGSFRLLHLDFNANSVALRSVTCAIVLYRLLRTRWLAILCLLAGMGIAFVLQSRTSTIAAVAALVLSHVEFSSRRERNAVPVITMLLLTGLITYQSTIREVFRDLAISNLGSNNAVAQFFLSDKDVQKVNSDYLDRADVWAASINRIQESPFFGHGIGMENVLFGARSHNAYLSLLVEGGVFYLLAWGGVYFILFMKLYDSRWSLKSASSPLFSLMVTLFSYMLVAALVETSGIGSVATPNNVITIFLALWFCYHVPMGSQQVSTRPRLAAEPKRTT